MAAAAHRDAHDRDRLDAIAQGRRTYMEHGPEARRALAACFDRDLIRRRLGVTEEAGDPLLLYFSDRRMAAFSPNLLFDETWYLDAYADVAESVRSGTVYSGFTHFVIDGLREGRAPNATVAVAMSDRPGPDSAPPESFDEARYLDANPFARTFLRFFPVLGACDFHRLFGARLGQAPAAPRSVPPRFEAVLAESFDADYYRARYLSAEVSSEAALRHYVEEGSARGYNPSDAFDETWYRLFYTDVAAAVRSGAMKSGFHHYVVAGRGEDRRPKHDVRYALEARMAGISEPRLLQRAGDILQRTRALPHAVSTQVTARVWFCLPNLNPDLSFGGYKAVFELMKAVAGSGRPIGILVTEDRNAGVDYFVYLEKDEALRRIVSEAAYVNRSVGAGITIHRDDVFVVYSVWDAYVVQPYLRDTRAKRFLLFAQEYEPIFYECGSARALTQAAYGCAHVPLFNSRFLARYFVDQGIGPCGAAGAEEGRDFHVFDHVPTRLRTRPLSEARGEGSRTLAFYARPEMHAARNLFELGYLALRRLCAEGLFDASWRFVGLGGLSEDHALPLGHGCSLQMVQKMPLEAYERFMGGIDVGLSLMFAPHPSVVPFEFAAAGAVVVTNVYENRSADDLRRICANIVPCEPTLDGVADALREAVARAGDVRTREAQRLALPARSWADVFAPAFLETVFASLDGAV